MIGHTKIARANRTLAIDFTILFVGITHRDFADA